MINKILQIIIIFVFIFSALASPTQASSLKEEFAGKILLQVEKNGEAWYVAPNTYDRYFLGRPNDAFQIMKKLGLGVSENDYLRFRVTAPKKLWGSIILRVEENGEAYYIDTQKGDLHYLSRPADAFKIMIKLGTGISDDNLDLIPINNDSLKENLNIDLSSETRKILHVPSELELKTLSLINDYRESLGLNNLVWNDEITKIARDHSQNMSEEKVAFGHDGFLERSELIINTIGATATAENVAYNMGYSDPVSQAFRDWINSPGHRINIEGDYTCTAIGIYESDSEKLYFTQIFAKQ